MMGNNQNLFFSPEEKGRAFSDVLKEVQEYISSKYSNVGVQHGSCIDKKLIEKILGCKLIGEKDKNQREECGCFESVEVGAYNTCLNGCKYCYANFNDEKVKENARLYNQASPLLCGNITLDDKITDRKVKSLKDAQLSFFE